MSRLYESKRAETFASAKPKNEPTFLLGKRSEGAREMQKTLLGYAHPQLNH
ncbi:MAG: hypothetical protein U5L45_00005 [Saprospiraceae bacterium]|nr:hypothetical protein [Saprospiraceae bacterium]